MIENMLELVEKLEVYLLQISVDIRYEEIIKAYFSMFKQKYRNLSLENLIPEIKGETFPLKLYFPDVSGRNQSFECCFLINTLAVKAKKRGKYYRFFLSLNRILFLISIILNIKFLLQIHQLSCYYLARSTFVLMEIIDF